MFCAPKLIFDGTEGVGSRFHVLRARTHFRQYRVRRVHFSCFVVPDSFSAVPRAFDPVFIFCAPGLILGDTEGVGSRFSVLRAQTLFRGYRGRRVPFSCFALPNSFSAVPRASGPVFMICAPGLIFDGTEGVGSLFHVLRARTRFRQYRGRRVPFSCFTLKDSFSVVPRAYDPVFKFCASGLIFGGIEGVRSCFYALHVRTVFHRFRVRRVPFSCFARPDSFSTIPRASGPVFMVCVPRLIFGGTESVGSRFHILRARTHFRRCRVRRVPLSCFAPGLIFGATEGIRTRFHVLLSRRASGPVFMFSAHRLVFCGIGGVRSRFHVLPARARFRLYRWRRVPSSCFAPPDSFSAVPSASGPVFVFYAPGLVFGGTVGVRSRFHILRA
jgi:hypothetical protein